MYLIANALLFVRLISDKSDKSVSLNFLFGGTTDFTDLRDLLAYARD
jgi:hypothetical protein